MYNLNKGKNDNLLSLCKPLADYMTLIHLNQAGFCTVKGIHFYWEITLAYLFYNRSYIGGYRWSGIVVLLDYSYEEARERFAEYISAHGIKRSDVDLYIRKYPIATFKYYYELELDHVLV